MSRLGVTFSRQGEAVRIRWGDGDLRLPPPVRALSRGLGRAVGALVGPWERRRARPEVATTHVLDLGRHRISCSIVDVARPTLEGAFGRTLRAVAGQASEEPLLVVAHADPTEAPGTLVVRFRGSTGSPCRPVDLDAHLLPLLTRHVLDHEPDELHLHAGGVVLDDRAVLVVGASTQGKSTLVAHLAAGGAVLNDEVIGVDERRGQLTAFPRPLSLRVGGAAAVEALVVGQAPRPGSTSWVLPTSAIGARHVSEARPGLIVVPRRRPGPVDVHELAPLDVLEALLLNALDLPRRPADQLRRACWLVARSVGVAVAYEEAADVAGSVRDLDAVRGRRGAEVLHHLDVRVGAMAPAGDDPSVVTVLHGGRALLLLPHGRRVVRLNEVATAAWVGTGAGAHPEDATAFLEALTELGSRADGPLSSG